MGTIDNSGSKKMAFAMFVFFAIRGISTAETAKTNSGYPVQIGAPTCSSVFFRICKYARIVFIVGTGEYAKHPTKRDTALISNNERFLPVHGSLNRVAIGVHRCDAGTYETLYF